MADDDLVSGL